MRKMPQYGEVLDKLSEVGKWDSDSEQIVIDASINIPSTLTLGGLPYIENTSFITYERATFSIINPNMYYSLPNGVMPDANYPITFTLFHGEGDRTVFTMKYDFTANRIFCWDGTSTTSYTNVGTWFDRLDWNYSPVRGNTGQKFRFTLNQQFMLDNDVQEVMVSYARAEFNALPVNYYISL